MCIGPAQHTVDAHEPDPFLSARSLVFRSLANKHLHNDNPQNYVILVCAYEQVRIAGKKTRWDRSIGMRNIVRAVQE